MNIRTMVVSVLVGMGVSNFARASETNSQQPNRQESQTAAPNPLSDKDQLQKLEDAVKADKASGNKEQLKKDKALRRDFIRSHKMGMHGRGHKMDKSQPENKVEGQ